MSRAGALVALGAFACSSGELRPLDVDPSLPLPRDTGLPPPEHVPLINEFLPFDASGLEGATGTPTDWIELYAPGEEDVPLAGFNLTPSFGDPETSPLDASLVVPAHGFLLLLADGRPEDGPTHLSFTLPIAGEVALFWDRTPVDLIRYDAQSFDISAARAPDGSDTWAHDATPTPGASNGLAE